MNFHSRQHHNHKRHNDPLVDIFKALEADESQAHNTAMDLEAFLLRCKKEFKQELHIEKPVQNEHWAPTHKILIGVQCENTGTVKYKALIEILDLGELRIQPIKTRQAEFDASKPHITLPISQHTNTTIKNTLLHLKRFDSYFAGLVKDLKERVLSPL